MITKIGFTGPRTGMSESQADMLHFLLRNFKAAQPTTHSVMEFLHGDCVGADAQAHDIARYLGYHITAFPPSNPALRAFCKADEIRPTKPYLDRDRDIVDESEVLLAAINLPVKPHSGSWYTYKYAHDKFKRAWML